MGSIEAELSIRGRPCLVWCITTTPTNKVYLARRFDFKATQESRPAPARIGLVSFRRVLKVEGAYPESGDWAKLSPHRLQIDQRSRMIGKADLP